MAYYQLPSVDSIGGDRPCIVILPNAYRPNRAYPVKVVLHNLDEPDGVIISRLKLREMANYGDGQIIVCPDGRLDALTGNYFFNYYTLDEEDSDIVFVIGLLDALEDAGINIARVELIGYSNGAFLARQIRDRYPSRVHATVVFNGGLAGTNDLNTPGVAVPGIVINSVDDVVVLPAGQDPAADLPQPLTNHGGVDSTGYLSVAGTIAAMCTANGISSASITNYGSTIQLVSTDGGATQRARVDASTNGTAVERWTMPSPAAHGVSVVDNAWRNYIEPWLQENHRGA